VISCKNLQKNYNQLAVLKGIDLEIQAKEIVCITGESGAGKSTLLHLLGTLDAPSSGEIFFEEKNISSLKGNQLADFRNQNIAVANTPVTGVYNSYGASFDTKIFKEYTGDNTWSVGILFNGDHAGEGTLSTHDVSIATSYKLALDRYGSSFLSAGIQGGFTSKRLFSQDLIFGNQVEGFEFNPQVPNFETFLDEKIK
jgi:energy-coupling factor transporter ATP-binding protein EcfA2